MVHQKIKDKDSTGDKAVAKVQDPSRRQDQRDGWAQAHPLHIWGQNWKPRPELKWSPQEWWRQRLQVRLVRAIKAY